MGADRECASDRARGACGREQDWVWMGWKTLSTPRMRLYMLGSEAGPELLDKDIDMDSGAFSLAHESLPSASCPTKSAEFDPVGAAAASKADATPRLTVRVISLAGTRRKPPSPAEGWRLRLWLGLRLECRLGLGLEAPLELELLDDSFMSASRVGWVLGVTRGHPPFSLSFSSTPALCCCKGGGGVRMGRMKGCSRAARAERRVRALNRSILVIKSTPSGPNRGSRRAMQPGAASGHCGNVLRQ
mmetsp:Transcript_4147/g.9287  ORF Transcript_4147/g.9287 Transcript_4147/m.9287 type:complete len:245 (-) Transcript_4147:805-1539(-)